MKSLHDIYCSKSTYKSLDDYIKKLLSTSCSLDPIYKETSKSETWTGYESSSASERLDSDSEPEQNPENYVEKLAKSITIDSNPRKIKQKQFIPSDDITWLGVKPNTQNSLSIIPSENNPTVYRNEKGEKITKNSEKKNINEERLKQWSEGQVQKSAKESLQDLLNSEKNKPFARHSIDPEYEIELKKRPRFGDPIAEFSSFNIKKSKLSWENRFCIPPGKMWDGVDRSNGYEQRWLAKQGRNEYENSVAYKNFASEL